MINQILKERLLLFKQDLIKKESVQFSFIHYFITITKQFYYNTKNTGPAAQFFPWNYKILSNI